MKHKILAIVGMCGSGKTTAVDFFEKKGYQKVYFGGVIYDKMKEQNIEINTESQKIFRENLRRKEGMGAVAKILLPKIKKLAQSGNVVLDGLYSWEEYQILKEAFDNITVLAIVSDKKIRYERIAKRIDRPFSKEEAIKRDISEIENSNKAGPIAYADAYIINNGNRNTYDKDLETLKKKLEEIK